MNQRIRLTEGQFRQVIRESVERMLSEGEDVRDYLIRKLQSGERIRTNPELNNEWGE